MTDLKYDQKFIDQVLVEQIALGMEEGSAKQLLVSQALMKQLNDRNKGIAEKDDYNEHMNISATDKDGNTALHALANISAPKTFEAFAKAGLDPNAKNAAGNTPLHELNAESVRLNPKDTAELIRVAIAHGADTTAQNKAGTTVLKHLNDVRDDLADMIRADFRAAKGDVKKTAEVVRESESIGEFSKAIPVLIKPELSLEEVNGKLDSGLPPQQSSIENQR